MSEGATQVLSRGQVVRDDTPIDREMTMADLTNIFAEIPAELPEELVETLLGTPGLRIERIVSMGHASPEGFRYDQDDGEWVLLLEGADRLRFEGEEPIELQAGSFVNIPARRRHRVGWTAPASRPSGSPFITEIGFERQTGHPDLRPGPTPNTVRAADGTILGAPEGWVLLPPGDAGLTRRVKAAGDHWVVQEKVRRRMFSRGVWAASATIERIKAGLDAERSTEGYAKRQEAASRRREKVQAEYVEDFHGAVLALLAFPDHAELAGRLARAVADHATPVGSGTVARTERIPVEQRAEAAVIAWMRHQTTGYDDMAIPRVKGKRREVRRMLARRSQELLARYRRGELVRDDCPLKKALMPRADAG